jgi:hypothetical protein
MLNLSSAEEHEGRLEALLVLPGARQVAQMARGIGLVRLCSMWRAIALVAERGEFQTRYSAVGSLSVTATAVRARHASQRRDDHGDRPRRRDEQGS